MVRKIQLFIILTAIFLSGSVFAAGPNITEAFGGPINFFGFIPFCGLVIVVGPPSPMVAIYNGQTYKFNPPLPVPPNSPGSQKVVGLADLFNPNFFCPLPIVKKLGVGLPSFP